MEDAAGKALVLVTGASGFVAGHCIRELLEHGYAVRGTVRNLAARDKIAHLEAMAEQVGGSLQLAEADLSADDGWDRAVAGCAYVLHVASPFPPSEPDHEDELIRPAVDGTLRVLRASADSGTVTRVVLTSSTAAITSGHDSRGAAVRTESDWSNLDRSSPYQKSKTLAERAAWDFVDALPDDKRIELAVINPGLVLGPIMSAATSTSVETVRRLLIRDVPASPRIGFAPVDARDLAVAHRLAMERSGAAGNRYICAGDHIWMQDIAKILAAEFNPRGYRVPTGRLPTWLMWIISRFDGTVRLALAFVGRLELVSAQRAQRELGWSMRPVAQSIIDTATSLIEHGIVPTRDLTEGLARARRSRRATVRREPPAAAGRAPRPTPRGRARAD